jgi:hypothetical protein
MLSGVNQMIKNLLLLGSMLMNVALAYGLFLYSEDIRKDRVDAGIQGVNRSGQLHPVAQGPGSAKDIDEVIPTDTEVAASFAIYSDLVASLKQQNFPDLLIKQILLARINMEYLELEAQYFVESPYWKAEDRNNEDALDLELRQNQEKRDILLELFGEEVRDDPVFEKLFRPFNRTLGFLGSEKQIALYALVERNKSEVRDFFGPGLIREQMVDRQRLNNELSSAIQQILTPDEFFEYELRTSRTARGMRQSMQGFDYTEMEFRDLFAIRHEFEGQMQSPYMIRGDQQAMNQFMQSRDEQERRLSEYLGVDRYEELSRMQDPAFHSIRTIGERFGASADDIDSVYQVTLEAREKIHEMSRDQSLSMDQRRVNVEEAMAIMGDEVEQLVGEEMKNMIMENSFRMGMSRGVSMRAVSGWQ